MGKISIKEVALQAGVSTATVSHVLNGTRQVSDSTKVKVMDAVTALKYHPNKMASGFRSGKTNTIGIIVPDISNRFFSSLIEIIEEKLSTYNYHLIVANTKEMLQREKDHISYFISNTTDGIIIASTASDFGDLETVLPARFPTVFVDRKPKNLKRDHIVISSERAIKEGVSFLCSKNHKKIGYVSGNPRLSTNADRLAIFVQTMKDYGVENAEDYVRYGNSMQDSTRKSIDELLSIGCTALVVCNGLMTYEAQMFLLENSSSACGDIELVGFKDEYALNSRSHFISQPLEELGLRAVEQLIYRMNNPDEPIREIILNSYFIPSSGVPRIM